MKYFISFAIFLILRNFSAHGKSLNDNFLLRNDENLYTTHSESHRPVHVPVFERYPVNIPHPVPFAVPQYIRVPIPHPVPQYTRVQHPIEVPVYRVVPEIIEKPKPYTVERPFPIEIEKPFPIETVKKFEIGVPKPYPVHTYYYSHITENDPPPKKTKRNPKPKYLIAPVNANFMKNS